MSQMFFFSPRCLAPWGTAKDSSLNPNCILQSQLVWVQRYCAYLCPGRVSAFFPEIFERILANGTYPIIEEGGSTVRSISTENEGLSLDTNVWKNHVHLDVKWLDLLIRASNSPFKGKQRRAYAMFQLLPKHGATVIQFNQIFLFKHKLWHNMSLTFFFFIKLCQYQLCSRIMYL